MPMNSIRIITIILIILVLVNTNLADFDDCNKVKKSANRGAANNLEGYEEVLDESKFIPMPRTSLKFEGNIPIDILPKKKGEYLYDLYEKETRVAVFKHTLQSVTNEKIIFNNVYIIKTIGEPGVGTKYAVDYLLNLKNLAIKYNKEVEAISEFTTPIAAKAAFKSSLIKLPGVEVKVYKKGKLVTKYEEIENVPGNIYTIHRKILP